MIQALPPVSGQRLRAVRSFVRREGRITPAQQQALLDLWPRFGIEAEGPIEPAAAFGRDAPLCIEVGFGNGERLVSAALARPDCNYLGIEVHRPGVGRVLQRAEALELHNLRVVCADAVEVCAQLLPAACAAELAIFFPDPWPKKRHHKRRLIQPEFAKVLAQVLAPGGHLRLATDWADYARHMLEVLAAAPQFDNACGRGFAQRPPDRPLTRFEARGLSLGHAVFDLEFIRR